MAQFYKAPSSRTNASKRNASVTKGKAHTLNISVSDLAGNGMCLETKPITIVSQALAGEQVEVLVNKTNKKVQFAQVSKVINANPQRQKPFCELYGKCGGCSMQHCSAEFSLSQKAQALQSFFKQHHKVLEDKWCNPIKSSIDYEHEQTKNVGYRRRIRLAVDARNPKNVKIGYRQRNSQQVINVTQCPITLSGINTKLPVITETLRQLPSISNVGHIIVTFGDAKQQSSLQVALFVVKPLAQVSLEMLKTYACEHGLAILIYSKSAPTIVINTLSESLGMLVETTHINGAESASKNSSSATSKAFIQKVTPEQFVQVNPEVNKQMLAQAKEWLVPNKTHVMYDFFCGGGNFSLAFASSVKKIIGFEGIQSMVNSAEKNCTDNGIDNCQFACVDLSSNEALAKINIQSNSLVLLDPSREGAQALCEKLNKAKVEKILYVSCKPSSFARDLGILSEQYSLEKITALDMFPFTQHLEIMALFSRKST